jgi:acylphosphatase
VTREGVALRRLELTVTGRVQGVGFRAFAHDRAMALGLSGWVANEAGGSVRIVAEGSETALLRLRRDVGEGPAGGRVDNVAEAWGPATGEFETFGIRSRWHGGD